jgi:hypothetical protein
MVLMGRTVDNPDTIPPESLLPPDH